MHLAVLKMLVLKNNFGLKLSLKNFTRLSNMLLVNVQHVGKHGLLNLNQGQFMPVQDAQEIKNIPKNFLVKIP